MTFATIPNRRQKKNKRFCSDCAKMLSRQSRSTKKCRACHVIYKKQNKRGFHTNLFCRVCSKELTIKKNKTGLCLICLRASRPPAWNRGLKGLIPWNKGKSKYRNEKEKRKILLEKRKAKYYSLTPQQKMADRIRTLIRNTVLKKAKKRKESKTQEIIGCSIPDYLRHLESQFQPGMTWDNYGNGEGKWSVDHIKPVSFFDLSNAIEVKAAFNFKNCRPLWSIENSRRGNRVPRD